MEYTAIRNAASVYDLCPMVKYRISGKDAAAYLNRLTVRNAAKLSVGGVHYTIWCDDAGKIIDKLLELGEPRLKLMDEAGIDHVAGRLSRQQERCDGQALGDEQDEEGADDGTDQRAAPADDDPDDDLRGLGEAKDRGADKVAPIGEQAAGKSGKRAANGISFTMKSVDPANYHGGGDPFPPRAKLCGRD